METSMMQIARCILFDDQFENRFGFSWQIIPKVKRLTKGTQSPTFLHEIFQLESGKKRMASKKSGYFI